ncbi:MAG TPA: CpsD/CapB family tyrosine-protein kinase [Planctomycetia bacterium]|nr:CpsD/CapB family tyrosine-protein kinase [Planctomycetia bacterium]
MNPPSAPPGVDLRFLLDVWRRRGFAVLVAGSLLGVIGALAGKVFFRPAFESTAWFRATSGASRIEAFEENLKSPPVLVAALARPEIASLAALQGRADPVAFLRRGLSTHSLPGGELFTASFRSADRAAAQPILAAVAEEFARLAAARERDARDRLLDALESLRAAAAKRLAEPPDPGVSPESLIASRAADRDRLASLTAKLDAVKLECAALPRLEIVEGASAPAPPSGLAPAIAALSLSLAGLCLPFLLVACRDVCVRPIGGARELVAATANAPLLGELVSPPRPRADEWARERFEEGAESLRLALDGLRDRDDLRTFAICSARPREGKSTLATRLAESLARGGAGRVLLVDGDLRCSRLHEVWGVRGSPGLADYLADACDLLEAAQPTSLPRLDFLPAGVPILKIATLLAEERFVFFLHNARAHYDFVVIDTPPLLPVSDGLTIAAASDGVVLCALCDRSDMPSVAAARRRLAAVGARLVGVALNGAPDIGFGTIEILRPRKKPGPPRTSARTRSASA